MADASADPERPGAERWVPDHPDLKRLRAAAPACRGCELWQPASQVVFSSGPPGARVVLVGEQPGDVEDREGEPFVGPAGRLLMKAVDDAGLERDDLYLTNAVKHFRFTQQGKRRIHQTPDVAHVLACRPWLEAELQVVQPEVVVAMGATAARAVLGPGVKVTRQRGQVVPAPDADQRVVPTVHPSSVLRARARKDFAAYDAFVADLRVVAGLLG
ncbi:MAG TPA: UdgX family uracil-DNA binding protein [Angustibacter sp.]|nr:UdgX family uracil-DNA binding protein [Angustibacter sp.]